MIHRFSVANYYSIREEVVLDLRIPGTAPDLPGFRRSEVRPDVRLPTVAVLMGPNGSGKTTLLRALVTTCYIAASRPNPDSSSLNTIMPFLSGDVRSQPTRICVEFESNTLLLDESPQLFRYELIVDRRQSDGSSGSFDYEALYHFPKGRARRLFERGTPEKPIYVASEFDLSPRDARLKAVRTDASVISTLAMFNVPLAMRIVKWLGETLACSNIAAHLTWAPRTDQVVDLLERNPELGKWISKQILCSDLGITGFGIAPSSSGTKDVWFNHEGLDHPILLKFESSGTKRLFHLLPQLSFALRDAGVAILDEIDGDLHVDIAGEILHWFRSRERNPRNAQLLVTSHNVGLLDALEKEEVFIVEKNGSGATHVHGAQDVRGLRRDTHLYPKYRAGVLGGIPRIG